ncbi:MAG: hypothetical protein LQ339_001642 [Xanthoria mediterranea]|nr:MAG: hypothetical protein LQ339_001642 [Xanthoria mediterranea]
MSNHSPVSLSLHKLSFCTTATLHSKMVWEHLSGGSDMYAVFDHVRKPGLGQAVSEKQVLRLVRDGHLLEEIDLENLSFQVRLDEEKFRSQQIRDSDRYVVLVIRRPAAALRYQLSTGEVRRIQMNFRPESGYDFAVNIFRAIGVPLSDKNISPPASQGSLSRPVPQWSSQQVPQFQGYNGDIQTSKHLEGKYPHQYSSSDLGVVPRFATTSNGSAFSSGYALQGQSISLHSPTRPSPGQPSARRDPQVEERATTSYTHAFTSSITRNESPERPATAPLTLGQLMPPKRELPFAKELAGEGKRSELVVEETPEKAVKRPASRAKAKQIKQPSRPSSSRMKPKPESSKQGGNAEQSMIVRLKTGPRSDENTTDPLFNLPIIPTTSAPKKTIAKPIIPEVPINKPNTRSRATISSPRTDPLTPSRTNTETILPQKTVNTAPNTENILPNATANDITPEEYMSRLDHWVRKYQNLPAPPPPDPKSVPASTDKDQLAAFAAQPEATRLAAIDDMICECLDDPNFATLVADVEKSWKRIGLGF